MTDTQGRRGRPGLGRWGRVALVLSLMLNLAFLGIGAGAVIGHAKRGPMMVRDLGFGPYTGALSDADRRALREAFAAARPGLRDIRREWRAEMQGLVTALRAEPYDPEAARTILAAQQERNRERLELGQRLLIDRLAAMAPEDRHAFADRLEEMLRRPPGGPGPRP